MNQNSFLHPLKLILGFLAIVLIAALLGGCGSLMRVEYGNPKFGAAAVEFNLPAKKGLSK